MLEALDEPITGPKPEAFRRQIASLKIGESAAKAQRLPLGSTEAADLAAFMRRFRISIDSQVSKERKASSKEFVVEQGSIMCNNGHVIAAVVVTRTEPTL